MDGLDGLFPRRALEVVEGALEDTRVVVITGARQTGKSTLARLVVERKRLPKGASDAQTPRPRRHEVTVTVGSVP